MKNILASKLTRHVLSATMGVGLLTVLIMGTAGTALAAGPSFNIDGTPVLATLDSITITEIVSGTPTTYNNDTTPFALDGKDHTVNINMPITLTDFSGNLAGWHVSLTTPNFTAGGHSLADPLLSTFTAPTQINSGDAIAPTNTVTNPISLDATPRPVYSTAAGTGVGEFTLTPVITLDIPATTYQGTYSSTFAVAVVSGP